MATKEFDNLGRLYEHILFETKQTLEQEVAEEVKEILKKYIDRNFYQKYRINATNQLWDSLRVKPMRNGLRQVTDLWIYFDVPSVNHRSWFGSESLGISSGDKVYTPQWINDGWTFLPSDSQTSFGGGTGTSLARIRDVAQAPQFMEDTINALNSTTPHIRKLISSLKKKKIFVER